MTTFGNPLTSDLNYELEHRHNEHNGHSEHNEQILSALGKVDWDFPTRVTHSTIEGVHPYPAKFIAEIPRALVSALPVPKDTAVLDPFCGSGTSLVESQRKGLSAVGVDLNPIACLISRVKTEPVPEKLLDIANNVIEDASTENPVSIPDIPNLDHWFESDVQHQLARLMYAIEKAPATVQTCLRLALSSIVVRVSNQESDTRYAAIRKKQKPNAVRTLFLRSVEKLGVALLARNYPLTPVDVIEADILTVTPDQINKPVGLVVTSPPYPNAYEYWLYHKYRMWWLGFDPLKVKEQEIGARAHFFRKNHHTADDFARQMETTFSLLSNVVVKDGFVCLVIGRSRIHGQIIDNARIVERVAGDLGFRKFFSAERVVSPHRKSFNLSHANIKTETVLITRNECT